MSLCGSLRCGCGLVGRPVGPGGVNGVYPQFRVEGSGEPGDPYDVTFNPDWGPAVIAGLVGKAPTEWLTYTPVVTQASTNVTVTASYSKYARLGQIVMWNFLMSTTSPGVALGILYLTLPVVPNASDSAIGVAQVYSTTTATRYICAAGRIDGTARAVLYHDTSANNAWGQVPNVAVGTGSAIRGSFVYQAAS